SVGLRVGGAVSGRTSLTVIRWSSGVLVGRKGRRAAIVAVELESEEKK
ncbi:unnamed protein product, partial [Tilletia controversa]